MTQPDPAGPPSPPHPEPSVLPDEIVRSLALALAPVEPPAARREAIWNRTRARLAPAQAGTPLVTVRGGADGWIEVLPKVHAKRLYTDGVAESYLVRLEAGARAPAHDHPAPEECLVLEGSVRYVGAETLNAGDFQVAPPGAHHTELVSDAGALVLLRYARPLSEYLPL